MQLVHHSQCRENALYTNQRKQEVRDLSKSQFTEEKKQGNDVFPLADAQGIQGLSHPLITTA